MEYINQINYYINTFHFPSNYTKLSMNEISFHYDCSLQLFLDNWTVCQCGPCTHILNSGRFYSIYCCTLLSYKQNTFHAVYFRLPSQLQWSFIFPNHTHTLHGPVLWLYNFPLSALLIKYGLIILFPTNCRYRCPRKCK